MSKERQQPLAEDGYALLPAVFTPAQVDAIVHELESAFAADADGSTLRTADGSIYGARNVLYMWPGAAQLWRQPPLPALLDATLGPAFGLVRVLYFDKPPESSWALPWHRDLTIAVKNNRLPSEQFSKPTLKAGVPHVEAPRWLLENMLTLRVHLDDVTEANGPLKVLPASHQESAASSERTPVSILGRRGDVLAMRPLLSHASNRSLVGTTQHRRVLHYEFSGIRELPDGYAWHDFLANGESNRSGTIVASPLR